MARPREAHGKWQYIADAAKIEKTFFAIMARINEVTPVKTLLSELTQIDEVPCNIEIYWEARILWDGCVFSSFFCMIPSM